MAIWDREIDLRIDIGFFLLQLEAGVAVNNTAGASDGDSGGRRTAAATAHPTPAHARFACTVLFIIMALHCMLCLHACMLGLQACLLRP